MDITERLAMIDLGPTIQVPADLEKYVVNKETLKNLESGSLIAEAQETMRLLVPAGTATHSESEEQAEPFMGVANYYTLCRNRPQVDMLGAEDKLKILAILGVVHEFKGYPVIEVDTATALASMVRTVPTHSTYGEEYLADRNTTDRFFKSKKDATDDMEHKQVIMNMWRKFKSLRYAGATPGCNGITASSHPIHREFDANETWELDQPEGYTPREGAHMFIWNCKQ